MSRSPSRPPVVWYATPTVLLPRVDRGMDWGYKLRKLVIRSGPKVVCWVPGSTGWVSRSTTGYYESHLVIIDESKGNNYALGDRVTESGRLSTHLKNPVVLKRIADFLGCKVKELPPFTRGLSYVQREPTVETKS